MYRDLFVFILFMSVVSAVGCGGASVNSANSNSKANTNTAVALDPANMPAGLSATPIGPSANTTPGIPANTGPLPKGTTPTPGIPSAAELKKGLKPGTTPTPGIPDQETIRKAMGMPAQNANTPPPTGRDVPMMKSKRKTPGNTQ